MCYFTRISNLTIVSFLLLTTPVRAQKYTPNNTCEIWSEGRMIYTLPCQAIFYLDGEIAQISYLDDSHSSPGVVRTHENGGGWVSGTRNPECLRLEGSDYAFCPINVPSVEELNRGENGQ